MVEVGAADVEVVKKVVVVVAAASFILATSTEERREVWWQRQRKECFKRQLYLLVEAAGVTTVDGVRVERTGG